MMCREVERSSLPSFYGTQLSARRGIYCATLLVIVFKIISPFRFLSLKKQDWNDVFFLENQSTAPFKLSVKTWQWLHVYFLATTTFSSSDFVSDSESEEELLWVRSAGTSLILKIAIYCPQGSGTLRQQLLMMHCITWYWIVLHSIAWYCMVLHCIA